MIKNKIMVVDDEPSVLKEMRILLQGKGYNVVHAHSGDEALALFTQERPDVVLLDIRMPGRDGLETLKDMGRETHTALVIMTTAVNEATTAVEAMKLGAYDYLIKPINSKELFAALDRAVEHISLKQEVERRRTLQQEEFSMEGVVAASPAMKKVFELATTLGRADRATVCITGETGVGKEVVARAIHQASPRSDQPMVVVNCGAIPKELIGAELLGYAKGAFTGAAKEGKKGKVELAHRGTLFLDEVGELPPEAQVVLLRILDHQPFFPVGSDREVRVDVRIIAATNRNLEDSVTDGTFREDLFYRLNVAPIYIPPLRERIEDIIPMAKSYLQEFSQKYGKTFQGFSKRAASMLDNHYWQGNVRELKNAIERVVVYENASEVNPENLSFLKTGPFERDSFFDLPAEGIDIEDHFKDLILQALDKTQGNQSQAARLLGISLSTLRCRREKYGLTDQ